MKLAEDIFGEGTSVGAGKYNECFCYLSSGSYVKIYYENKPVIIEVMVSRAKIIDGENEIIIEEPYYKISGLYRTCIVNFFPSVTDGNTGISGMEEQIKNYYNNIVYIRKEKVHLPSPINDGGFLPYIP